MAESAEEPKLLAYECKLCNKTFDFTILATPSVNPLSAVRVVAECSNHPARVMRTPARGMQIYKFAGYERARVASLPAGLTVHL